MAVVEVHADSNVGLSFQADPVAANNNTAIKFDSALKTAVETGDDLLIGNRILVGHFTISDTVIQQHATDLGYLLDPNRFIRYGSEVDQPKVGDTFPIRGHFADDVNTGNADALGLVNKQIYLFVLGSTDNSTYARSVSTAFQIGIFYYDVTALPATPQTNEWKFRSEVGIPNNNIIDLSDLSTNNAGATPSAAARMVLGGFGPDKSNFFTNSFNLRLASIPEPGTAAMALVGGIAMLLRRRRR